MQLEIESLVLASMAADCGCCCVMQAGKRATPGIDCSLPNVKDEQTIKTEIKKAACSCLLPCTTHQQRLSLPGSKVFMIKMTNIKECILSQPIVSACLNYLLSALASNIKGFCIKKL
jgi:hypothetical protein